MITYNYNFFGFLLLGLGVMYYSFFEMKPHQINFETEEITLVLSSDIENVPGRKGEIDYLIYAQGFEEPFMITKGTISNLSEDKLVRGISAIITIDKADASIPNKVRPIYSLKTDQIIFSKDDYNINQFKYGLRKRLLYFAVGFLAMMYAFFQKNTKWVYITAGLFVVLALSAKIFRFGVY